MRATTTLVVPDDLKMTVELELTVAEADALLKLTADTYAWPMGPFRDVLRRSLGAARNAHTASLEIQP